MRGVQISEQCDPRITELRLWQRENWMHCLCDCVSESVALIASDRTDPNVNGKGKLVESNPQTNTSKQSRAYQERHLSQCYHSGDPSRGLSRSRSLVLQRDALVAANTGMYLSATTRSHKNPDQDRQRHQSAPDTLKHIVRKTSGARRQQIPCN